MRGTLPLAAGAIAVVALALAARVAHGPGVLGYDALWALRWGAEIAGGEVPAFEAAVAPTPHPLANLVSAGLSGLGPDTATRCLLALSWLSLGALAVGLARLGAALFSWPVGWLAGALVLTRSQLVGETAQALVDLPFLALALFAADREVRHPRAGATVPVLLVLGGLLRPEGWALEGAYLVYRWRDLDRRGRAGLAALLACAPVLWAAMDLWATGDLLHSLHGTQALGELLERPSGTGSALGLAPAALRDIVQTPLLWVALAGAAAGLLWRERASALPGAVMILGLTGFVVLGVAGLPVLGRYLLLPAAMLVLFAAVAVLGWSAMAGADRARRRWMAGGVVAAAIVLAGVPGDARRLHDIRDFGARRHAVQDDLRAAVRAVADRKCARVVAPDSRALAVVQAQLGPLGGDDRRGELAFAYADPSVADGYSLGRAGPSTLGRAATVVHAGRFWRAGVTGC